MEGNDMYLSIVLARSMRELVSIMLDSTAAHIPKTASSRSTARLCRVGGASRSKEKWEARSSMQEWMSTFAREDAVNYANVNQRAE